MTNEAGLHLDRGDHGEVLDYGPMVSERAQQLLPCCPSLLHYGRKGQLALALGLGCDLDVLLESPPLLFDVDDLLTLVHIGCACPVGETVGGRRLMYVEVLADEHHVRAEQQQTSEAHEEEPRQQRQHSREREE